MAILGTNWVIPLTALLSSIVIGACAEGTKVDVDTAASGGAGTGAAGGTTGMSSNGGSASGARGGTALGDAGGKAAIGGATSTTLVYSGGFSSSMGGALGDSGGTPGTVGSGGVAISTVPAPTSGLGISIITQTAGTTETKTDFNLVNRGSAAVDLKTVKIRYYFTIDAWNTPVFDIDYAGSIAAAANIRARLYTIEPAQPTADRYFELTFVAASTTDTASLSLGATGETRVNSRLHEQSYGPMTASNDYSYVAAAGFTDRITVYMGDQLVWGIEPGTPI